ncbi:hypothetical protein J7F01_00525 [Streptomyces sp. ISL-22]|nr:MULTISPECIES: hypothetical protein [Streptomyces]MBT2421410.1 hypothetical protein [Streptomyces sp. ISL-24]MBT2430709.1 hypothetical protein [Streptomyces sp. ISL-22]
MSESEERGEAVGAGRQQPALRAHGRPTTTVPVIPLWERPREGACR